MLFLVTLLIVIFLDMLVRWINGFLATEEFQYLLDPYFRFDISSLIPTIIFPIIVWGIMQLPSQSCRWSRLIIVGILLFLTGRYFLWRSFDTLNFTNSLNLVVSLGLILGEMVSVIQLLMLTHFQNRPQNVDQMELDVLQGKFKPSIDILIPTYNEPLEILQRTLIGCQALNYQKKKIYILDDGQRKEVQKLAKRLGCRYIRRKNNLHAKAGNLNYALPKTFGELIVVFDADFVPTTNFLTRTIGFFQDSQTALVQTPQSFYNIDPIAHNLGLENQITTEEELFYRHIQPLRDAAKSMVCCGTSFVIRRKILKKIGGFYTNSLTEDYHTGVFLSAQGYQLIYLDEKLSAGLAAENINSFIAQRLRWARGSLQGLFLEANPLTIPGLTLLQRIVHLQGLLYWFTSFIRIFFLFLPVCCTFFNIVPLQANFHDILSFLIPYYSVSLLIFPWINSRSRSLLISDVYSVLLCFPIAWTVIQTLISPFDQEFKVTPKGIISDQFTFNFYFALPLLILWIFTGISLIHIPVLSFGSFWHIYNLLILTAAIIILVDAPKPNSYPWLDLKKAVDIQIINQNQSLRSPKNVKQKIKGVILNLFNVFSHHNLRKTLAFKGQTTMVSEEGAEIIVDRHLVTTDLKNKLIILHLKNDQFKVSATITNIIYHKQFTTLKVQFQPSNLKITKQLIKTLFCRPNQWKRGVNPTEFKSLLLLLNSLLQPKFLFNRRPAIIPLTVHSF